MAAATFRSTTAPLSPAPSRTPLDGILEGHPGRGDLACHGRTPGRDHGPRRVADFVQFLTPRDMSKCAVEPMQVRAGDGGGRGNLERPDHPASLDDRPVLAVHLGLRPGALGQADVAVNSPVMDVAIRDAEVSVIQVQGPEVAAQLMAEPLSARPMLDLQILPPCDGVCSGGTELRISPNRLERRVRLRNLS